jgi:hypothetical protein
MRAIGVTEDYMRSALAKACQEAGSQRQWALDHDLSEQYVSDILSGRRDVSEKVAAALGWRRVVKFERD